MQTSRFLFVFSSVLGAFENTAPPAQQRQLLTPSLPQPVTFPGWKLQGRAFKQYIFRSHNESAFSAMRCHENANASTFNGVLFDENPFTCQSEKENKKAYGFQTSPFYWSFSSDITAVMGFIRRLQAMVIQGQRWSSD